MPALPPLPDGFALDAPALPNGFTLDTQAPAPQQPDNSGVFGTAARVASGLGQALGASMQGTSPVVRDVQGHLNYQPLGPAFQDELDRTSYQDDSGKFQPVDPKKHVVLFDPDTNKPTVFQRSPDTDERIASLGRLLGFGATSPSSIPMPNFAAPAVRAITNRFGGTDTQALNRVGTAMRADAEAGGPGPAEITQGLTSAGDAPMNVLDVAGENVRGLGGQVARMPGPGRQQMIAALSERDAQAGPRLAQAVNDTGASGDSTFLTAQALSQQAKQAAAPLYGKAYLAPPLNPDLIESGGALDRMMSRPSMQQAAMRAINIAKEEGRDPMSLGLTFNAAGDTQFEKVPSWQTLDYLKRGLDDVLNTYRDTTTGRLNLDEGGLAVDQSRRAFLRLIDESNPDYAAARSAYSGPQQSRGALMQGANALNKNPDEIASEIGQLQPSDQSFYRLGAANALKTTLAKTSSGGDEARAIIGNAYRQAQLKAIFPNADQMLDVARGENTMFGTKRALLGGSDTAARLAQDQGEGSGLLKPLAEAITAGATHEPILAAKSGLSFLQSLMKGNTKMSPEVASKVAELLLQGDPQAARAWTMDAFTRAGPAVGRIVPTLMPGEHGR